MSGKDNKFCHHCGRKLEEKLVPAGYDTKTGEKIYNRELRCPKSLRYHGWMWDQDHFSITLERGIKK